MRQAKSEVATGDLQNVFICWAEDVKQNLCSTRYSTEGPASMWANAESKA